MNRIGWMVVLLLAALTMDGCKSSTPQTNYGLPQAPDKSNNPAVQAVIGERQNIHNSLAAGTREQCRSNLQQVRAAIQMAQSSEGQFPASLDQLDPQVRPLTKCPSNGQPYMYNPSTGEVHCTTPGHEQL